MPSPAFTKVYQSCVATMRFTNRPSETIFRFWYGNHMDILCEALYYVKLRSLLSLLSFILLSLFSYLLHIIGAFLQAHRAIVRHWVSAMEEAF